LRFAEPSLGFLQIWPHSSDFIGLNFYIWFLEKFLINNFNIYNFVSCHSDNYCKIHKILSISISMGPRFIVSKWLICWLYTKGDCGMLKIVCVFLRDLYSHKQNNFANKFALEITLQLPEVNFIFIKIIQLLVKRHINYFKQKSWHDFCGFISWL